MCMIALTVKCNGVIKIAFLLNYADFIILIVSLVNLTFALKALFSVTM